MPITMPTPTFTLPAWLLAVALLVGGGCRSRDPEPPRPGSRSISMPTSAPALSVAGVLSDLPGASAAPDRAGGGGFARALAPRAFTFPDDDGPHPAFRSEWWYFTGVLRVAGAAVAGRQLGYEMTIFRQALAAGPKAPRRASAWATRDVFMGHFAITDVGAGARPPSFHAYERFARDGLALAGATARPFAVWIDDWRMDGPRGLAPSDPDAGTPTPASLPLDLAARADDGSAIALTLGAPAGGRGPIAQGDCGLSAKGPLPGNASYYYSRTRLPTRGRVTIARASGAPETFEVTGLSWMDREWSTAGLGAGVRGWDWLGVHLSDGRDLMMYRLRDADGRPTAESRLTLIGADGQTRHFGPAAFVLTPLAHWVSPHSGARYPTSFQLDIPGEALRLLIRPLVEDQELHLALVYWEGAVSIQGTSQGTSEATSAAEPRQRPLHGEGYLELTGYDTGERRR